MDIDIHYGPGNAAARVQLGANERVTAEAGAMIAMSGDMNIETTTHKAGQGGVLKAMRRALAGESFFMNHYTASSRGGDLWLATTLPGDMKVFQLADQKLIVQGGSFVAAPPSIDIDFGWQGFKTALAGEGLFWLHISGTGPLIVNSFGAIYPIAVDGEVIVDSGHIVAFDETLDFSITKAGTSWISSFLGGEGLVCKFTGTGTVWCQSHNPPGFGKALGPMLRPR
ncbi:MAG: TIGR00266 family protein [Acidobacteriota bacterium]